MQNFNKEKFITGYKQSLRNINANNVKTVFLAYDVSENISTSVLAACNAVNCEDINREYNMAQLGSMAEIDVPAAVIVELK